MYNQERQSAIEHYIKAYNDFDVEGMLRDLHREVVFKNISNGETSLTTSGIEAFRAQAEQAKQLFSQREQKIQKIRFGNDSVDVDILYKGVLSSDLPNSMKAGDTITLNGKSVYRFQDNKIVEIQDIS